MADEVLLAGIADLVTAEEITGQYLQMRADRSTVLLGHPALYYAGDQYGRKSATTKVPLIGMGGYDDDAQVNVGTAFANTALTDDSFTLTAARRGKQYTVGDHARFVTPDGVLDARMFAEDAMKTQLLALVKVIAAAGAGFTASVDSGSTGTFASLRRAIQTAAEAYAEGPLLGIIAMKSWHQVQIDIGDNLAGVLQYDPEMGALARRMGLGYAGRLLDLCDIVVTDRVPESGGDKVNTIVGRNGIAWNDMEVSSESAEQLVIGDGHILFERDRDASKGQTAYVSQYWLSAGIGDDGAGLRWLVDA